jgi:hypothetical protein
MATQSWATFVDQSTDAAFRTWGSELSAKFGAVGMVQTADTGQINWTTVTRAATNTAAGYEIWKLSSGNLFFKFEYGSGASNAIPSLWMTVGTGSNGSGTLTGQVSTRTQFGATNNGILSTTTNYQSYLCATANYFGLAWKIASSAAGTPRTFMAAMQTVDNTGAGTGVGYLACGQGSGAGTTMSTQCVGLSPFAGVGPVINTFNNGIFWVPNITGLPANSLDGSGNNQAFLWWWSIFGSTPAFPLLHVAAALQTDIALGVTASMTLIGTTAHTYISIGNNMIDDAKNLLTIAGVTTVMLFE